MIGLGRGTKSKLVDGDGLLEGFQLAALWVLHQDGEEHFVALALAVGEIRDVGQGHAREGLYRAGCTVQ